MDILPPEEVCELEFSTEMLSDPPFELVQSILVDELGFVLVTDIDEGQGVEAELAEAAGVGVGVGTGEDSGTGVVEADKTVW